MNTPAFPTFRRSIVVGAALAVIVGFSARPSFGQDDAEDENVPPPTGAAGEIELLAEAAKLANSGRRDEAKAVLDTAIERFPGSLRARDARADFHALAGEFDLALADLDAAIEHHPDEAWLHQRRGEIRFFAADIDGALADFDRYLGRHPERRPHHWQRGLALYYVGRYRDGVAQFELHRTVNPDDVENAVWHFLCLAGDEGLEAARRNLIPYTEDSRVPMRQIHELFAGTGSEEAVLKAAAATDDELRRRNHLCFAHLYLGLHHEAAGNTEKSLEHIRKAAVDFAMPHYMGRTAQVHLKLRTAEDKPDSDDGPEP